MKTLEATNSDTTLLGFFSQVRAGREKVIVTQDGKPIAQVIPIVPEAADKDPDSIFGFYKGKIEIKGDIMAPLYTDEELEGFLQASAAQFK